MSVMKINNTALIERLEQVANRLSDTTPLAAAIASSLDTVTQDNFDSGGRPTWAGLSTGGASRLYQSGTLRDRIVTDHNQNEAIIGTDVPYAAIHQFGGKTKAHVIRPKTKKALAFGGRVVKSVNHPGSNIPARPFLPIDANGFLQPEAEAAIFDDVDHFYKAIFD